MSDAAHFQRPSHFDLHGEPGFGDYVALLKPRVMSLVVFSAAAGLIAAPGVVHPMVALAAILFVALGAGASGALNMWYDADVDAVMRRTRGRPVPAGRVEASDALALGLGLSGLAVVMLTLAGGLLAGALLAFTIFFYAVVYTMWLKRLTPQNIVIGGAAGAFPPVIGWAVATGGVSLEPALMFALIFLWTPPHFWALALFTRSDYDDAGIPMLTVTHGRAATRRQVRLYALALTPAVLGLALTPVAGPAFWLAALILHGLFLRGAWAVGARDEATAEADRFAAERGLFRLSLLYLLGLFGALIVDATAALLLPWPTGFLGGVL